MYHPACVDETWNGHLEQVNRESIVDAPSRRFAPRMVALTLLSILTVLSLPTHLWKYSPYSKTQHAIDSTWLAQYFSLENMFDHAPKLDVHNISKFEPNLTNFTHLLPLPGLQNTTKLTMPNVTFIPDF